MLINVIFLIFIYIHQISCTSTKDTPKKIIKAINYKLSKFRQPNMSVDGLSLSGNKPCEDKFSIFELDLGKNKKGLFLSLLDGHGGEEIAEYANLFMFPYFLEFYRNDNKENNEDKKIVNALEKTYERIEDELLLLAFSKKIKGEEKFSNMGSCAMTAIVYNNKIYIANLGDSKARLFSYDSYNKKYGVKKITKTFNARKKEEQKILEKKFPNNKNIYICYNAKTCYVEGMLQPTRSFADFTLKYRIFNLPNDVINNYKKYESEINKYQGPYINSKPDIKIINLKKTDKFLIMATDGLWDDIKSSEIKEKIDEFMKYDDTLIDVDGVSFGLLYHILDKISKNNNMSMKQLLDMEPGKKLRNIHDDITIITCDVSEYLDK